MSVPPFLQKTYEIVSEPAFKDVCGWGESDDSIFIKNIDEFAKTVLPKYFKHSNYSSFTRQLHKYDFHKTVHNPRHGEFKHQYFLKGQPQLMKLIQRKIYVGKNSAADKAKSENISDAQSEGTSSEGHTDGTSSSGNTDVETDTSSDKDRSSVDKDEDFDFDFDFLEDGEEGGDSKVELDYDNYDEIEASVEKGIIAFDDERISILEKRQRHLMEENLQTKSDIQATLRDNAKMEIAIDCLLTTVAENFNRAPSERQPLEPPEDVDLDELCSFMKAKCKLKHKVTSMTDDMKNYMRSVLHPLHDQAESTKRAKAEAK